MGPTAEVVAGVALAAHNDIKDSCSFYLSTTSSQEYCILSSCLLTHGSKRAAAGLNITSTLKARRKVEEVALVPSISLYQESRNFP